MQEVYRKLSPVRTLPCRSAAWLLSMLFFSLLFFTLEVALVGVPSALANTITVTSTNDSGTGSLRQALIDAQADDTIDFNLPPNSTITVSSELMVTKAITVDGSTVIGLQVSGNHSMRVFNITERAVLQGFGVVKGNGAGDGGGIQSTAPLTLIDMRIEDNTATGSGGGVYANATLNIADTVFISNTAADNGGAVRAIFGSDIQDSRFLSNTASIGAGLSANDRTSITNTFFLYNGSDTTTKGGGFYHDFSDVPVTIVNSVFAGNIAQTGAALNFTQNANASLTHLTIVGSFGTGAALAVGSGTVGISNSIIASNTIGLELTGGSLFSDYNLFSGNTTDKSGAIGGGSNEVSGDPAFANPATDDYRLRMTSAARDKGTNVGIDSDFEWQDRFYGTAPDIGFDEVPIETNSRCYATSDDLIVFGSEDGSALQWAIDEELFHGNTIKVAGICAGMPYSVMANFRGRSMGMRGGYTITNWTTSDPVANPTILDALQGGRVLFNSGPSQLTVENLTIQNGNSTPFGGGIYADVLNLTNVNVFSSTSTIGGGVLASGAARIIGGVFSNNRATNGGGLSAWQTLILTRTQFISNTATSGSFSGGGVSVDGPAQITDAVFRQNTGSGVGGGLRAGDSLTLTTSTFQDNTSRLGGGAYVRGLAQVSGGTFQNNVSGSSDSMFVGGTLALTGTTFLSNTGGGLRVNGVAQIADALFEGNSGRGLFAGNSLRLSNTRFVNNNRGGVYAMDAVQVDNGLFQGNVVSGTQGGGLYVSTTLTMTGTQFISNTTNLDGGGAYVAGAAQVTGGVFQSNSARSGGGGLYVSGAVTVTNSRFLGNWAGIGGGALYHLSGTSRVVNSLFARNSIDQGEGAALFFDKTAGAQILHSTIASPTLVSGSAISVGIDSLVQITNTIIASHTRGLGALGTLFEDYNLFYGNNENTFGNQINGGTNDLTGNPAFLDPAADDYHLTASSAALDRAANIGITSDFEGQLRPQGLGSDIGYDESPFAATLSGLSAVNNSPTALGRATNFTATATGNNLLYTWNFGDGTPTATGASTVHSYSVAGNYTAVVTASNGISTLVASTSVTVTDVPTPDNSIRGLTASNNSPTTLGNATTFTATATGNNITYVWSFGDGTPTATGASTVHSYSVAGNYTAVVTASNGISTVAATTVVTITSAPIITPTAKISVTVEREGSGAVLPGTVVTYQVAITNTGGVTVQLTTIRGGVPTVDQTLDSAGVSQVDAACAEPINLAPAAVHRCSLTWVAAGSGGQQVNFVVTVNSSAANGQTSSVSAQSPVLIANPIPSGEQRVYLPVVQR